jgi:hypothetical protein
MLSHSNDQCKDARHNPYRLDGIQYFTKSRSACVLPKINGDVPPIFPSQKRPAVYPFIDHSSQIAHLQSHQGANRDEIAIEGREVEVEVHVERKEGQWIQEDRELFDNEMTNGIGVVGEAENAADDEINGSIDMEDFLARGR